MNGENAFAAQNILTLDQLYSYLNEGLYKEHGTMLSAKQNGIVYDFMKAHYDLRIHNGVPIDIVFKECLAIGRTKAEGFYKKKTKVKK